MKVLIVKTSSMGDIIHTLPAVTDAATNCPDIIIDWVVEENFVDIPSWHPSVRRIIPVSLRRWRKNLRKLLFNVECRQFIRALRNEQYDLIIDAQGLLKSALITRMARGKRIGLDRLSARESIASWFYHHKFSIDPQQHAICRNRQLFSKALGYPLVNDTPNFGVELTADSSRVKRYIVFLHGTTWLTKEWPEHFWIALAKLSLQSGFDVLLPWGNAREHQRAQRIQTQSGAQLLEKLNLTQMAKLLKGSTAVVAVDTGLGHLASAVNVPTLSIYGPTDAQKTGTMGPRQTVLSSSLPCSPCLKRQCKFVQQNNIFPPCFESTTPEVVWKNLQKLMSL